MIRYRDGLGGTITVNPLHLCYISALHTLIEYGRSPVRAHPPPGSVLPVCPRMEDCAWWMYQDAETGDRGPVRWYPHVASGARRADGAALDPRARSG
jgi:hypothetical protein